MLQFAHKTHYAQLAHDVGTTIRTNAVPGSQLVNNWILTSLTQIKSTTSNQSQNKLYRAKHTSKYQTQVIEGQSLIQYITFVKKKIQKKRQKKYKARICWYRRPFHLISHNKEEEKEKKKKRPKVVVLVVVLNEEKEDDEKQ